MVMSPLSTSPLSTSPLSTSPLSTSDTARSTLTQTDTSVMTSELPNPESDDRKVATMTFTYQHTDPNLNADLTFHAEGYIWVLSYYRQGQTVSSTLYQSRATAELLLSSLGYQSTALRNEESA